MSARNHGFDPEVYLRAIPADAVEELHLAGHMVKPLEKGEIVIDSHNRPVASQVWRLFAATVDRFGPRPTLIEWDTDIPPLPYCSARRKRPIGYWKAIMHSLRNLQSRFAEAVFDPKSTGFGLHVRANGLGGARRVSVYRNNVVNGLTEALRVSYPVVERLVGVEFFAHAARCYVRDVPSRSGNLHDYGAAFPAHLARLPGQSRSPTCRT